ECKKYNLPPEETKRANLFRNLKTLFNTRIKSIEEFYALVGSGKVVLNQKFMEKLFSQESLHEKKETMLDRVVTKVKTKPKSAILVKDIKSRLVTLAKCCSPINGEPITGYMTSGRGLTIHALRCPRLQKGSLDEQRLVDVSWDKTSTGFYQGTILIEGEDSPGVLAKMTSTIAQLGGNISKAEVKTFSDKKVRIKLSLRIKDIAHFQSIMRKITKIKEVDSVERI
ncbi:ACT domain-containing protein, partial [Acidobacteriota bacterium]